MPDTPTRPEIAADLRAAEARTETRIAQLSGSIETRFSRLDHKIHQIANSVGQLTTIISDSRQEFIREVREIRSDSKFTRLTIASVFVASVIGAVAAIWVTQGNMIAVFQAGLGIRDAQPQSEAAKGPPAAPPPIPALRAPPPGR
jgi:hypothetical protein